MSKERQKMLLQKQIDDMIAGIADMKAHNGSKFAIKQMERTRKSLQSQLDKLRAIKQDDTITFEQMGIDHMFLDEDYVKSFP